MVAKSIKVDLAMVKFIWVGLIAIGIIYGLITGRIDVINETILSSGTEGLDLIMQMMPVLVLWMGLTKIAENSGLLDKFSNLLSPLLCKLFPSLPKDSKALGYIASNIASNALGLGSAATPFGLKAMEEMQKDNPCKDTATEAMVTFLILNTGGVTIIPTTVIALRMMHGSANPSEIIITSILATICSSVSGLLMDYLIRRRNHKK